MITSQGNPRIKEIRKLYNRKYREQAGLAFIEGIRIVAEAVLQQARVEILVVAPELLTSDFGQEVVQGQASKGVPCLEVSAEVFRSLSLKDGPQGIGAIIHQRWEMLKQVRLPKNSFWVALDAVQDPGNLGSILRTCDAVGCGGVVLLGQSTDPYDPAALRGSMGAVFSQRLVKSSFEEFVSWKQTYHYSVVGTSGAASAQYHAISYTLPLVLLMGSERSGLSQEQQEFCDVVVKIPMVGRSDSLNLSVATGVVLYEIFAQRSRT